MTKKIILKWLEGQKHKACGDVARKKQDAKTALYEWKYAETKLEELVADIEPHLTYVYERMSVWHQENQKICGKEGVYVGSIRNKLNDLVNASIPLIEVMKTREFTTDTAADKQLAAKFSALDSEVRKTYDAVAQNVQALANAKLGMEYLSSLGFDLTSLQALDDKPVETALSIPINTDFLLLKKEVPHDAE